MKWFVKVSQQDYFVDSLYPQASAYTSDGLKIRDFIPNQDSISASFNDYRILSGIRDIPVSMFDQEYQPTNTSYIRKLIEAIKISGEINPLIVAVDKEGLYILEGGHRYDALKHMGMKTIPAMVVFDLDEPKYPTLQTDLNQGTFSDS